MRDAWRVFTMRPRLDDALGSSPYQAINAYQTSEGKIYNNHLRCPSTPLLPTAPAPVLAGEA